MKTKILIIIIIIIVLVIVTGGILLFLKNKNARNKQGSSNPSTATSQSAANNENASFVIKNIGVNLDYYDPATNRAGDFVFTKIDLPFDRLFVDYGFVIPAEQTADKKDATNPHPTLILPLGTKVQSMIDGTVIDIPKLYSNDYSVQVSADGTYNGIIFETEHVKNPIVKVGDKVKAGQIVAEVTDFYTQSHPGFGAVDIAAFKTNENGEPEHLCPFVYLDPSVKDEIEKKILAFYKAWEDYIGNPSLYNESSYQIPGCLTVSPIKG